MQRTSRKPPLAAAASLVLLLLGVMWLQEILDTLLGGRLDEFGIIPRSEVGLRGLLFAPFLHVGFAHLLSNTVPYAVLGFLIAARSVLRFIGVTVTVMLLGGLGVWLFASPDSVHLGASLLVFGYLGYLLTLGATERSLASLAVAAGVLLMYGATLWGVLPVAPGVSWQSHLFGFMAGGFVAFRHGRRAPR